MPRLLDRFRTGERSITTVDDYIALLNQSMGILGDRTEQTLGGKVETIGGAFSGLASQAFGANGVVFSVMAVRQFVFSGVRFRYQRLSDGKPADMFGTRDLELLETPWVGGTTQDMLSRMIQDVDLAGNNFQIKDTPLTRLGGDGGTEIIRLRPDWVDILTVPRMRISGRRDVKDGQLGWRKVGYQYTEGGRHSGNTPVILLPDEVAHFMPTPDPQASFRGMSWLTPVIREIENDGLMNRHKRKFFENGATPNMIIKHAAGADREAIIAFNNRLKAESGGVDNAYKTLNLYPGADATVVGKDLVQIDFKQVQGAGETRIAAAGGTPPVIVGLSEGLAASTYSNYAQARRRFGDGTMHPLWQNAAGSLAPLMPSAGVGTRLWYDPDNIPFLREDEKDSADINAVRATTIRTLVDGGYTPESAMKAVESGDFRLLKHTGLFSVQLQKPGANEAPQGKVSP